MKSAQDKDQTDAPKLNIGPKSLCSKYALQNELSQIGTDSVNKTKHFRAQSRRTRLILGQKYT